MSAEDEPETASLARRQGKGLRPQGLDGRAGTRWQPSPVEELDYIADMVQGLKAIAARAGCRTLTNLLDLAHREALQLRRAGGGR